MGEIKDTKVRVSVIMLKTMRAELDKLAEGENRSRSNYIESVLRKHINKQSKPDKQ